MCIELEFDTHSHLHPKKVWVCVEWITCTPTPIPKVVSVHLIRIRYTLTALQMSSTHQKWIIITQLLICYDLFVSQQVERLIRIVSCFAPHWIYDPNLSSFRWLLINQKAVICCNIPYGFTALHGPFMRSLLALTTDDSEDARKHSFPRQLVNKYRTMRDHVELQG